MKSCLTCAFDDRKAIMPPCGSCEDHNYFRPKSYWTPAERAGLKAMGALLPRSLPRKHWWDVDFAAERAIRSFVREARAVKDKERQ